MNDQLPTRTVQGYLVQPGGYVPRRMIGIQHLAKWKNDPEHVNAWLCKLIGSAFQSYVVMALHGQPAAEMLPMAAQLWVETLADMNLNEEQDKTRLETGIRKLTRQLKYWPQVASLIELMPNRETAPAAANVVQTRTVEDETAADAARVAAMKEMREKGLI